MGLFSASSFSAPQGGTGIYAVGGTITCCGGYKIHTFTSSGCFQVFKGGTGFQYLVIGGGGGGGRGCSTSVGGGGGGGAGGWRCCAAVSLTSCSFPVTIGLGGASTTNGQPSCFYDLVSAGGGAGGCLTVFTSRGLCGQPGGNGGGAGGSNCNAIPNNGAGNTPSTTPSQGFAGGCAVVGDSNGTQAGAGGGGAGATGGNAVCTAAPFALAGNGGAGKVSCISGTNVFYAGGGGGGGTEDTNFGCGGIGGGGNGGYVPGGGATPGTAGTANTGGGGGGAMGTSPGSCGGSGIVIVRYPI
jgi:hypothetical protein